MALMVASVPELTIRTISMDGISSRIMAARVFSLPVGAPKVSPS